MTTHSPLDMQQLAWPAARLAEAIEFAALRAGLVSRNSAVFSGSELPGLPAGWNESSLKQWIDTAGSRLGIEIEPMEATLAEIENLVRKAAPAILRIPAAVQMDASQPGMSEPGEERFVVLLAAGRKLTLLGVDLMEVQASPAAVRDLIYLPLVAPWIKPIDLLLDGTNIPAERRTRARLLMMEQQFANIRTGMGWMLRVSPGANLLLQGRLNQLNQPVLAFFVGYIVQTALQVFTWWFIGRGILSGQMEKAFMWAWALALFSAIPFQLLVNWSESYMSIMVGALFKQRLLYGALKMQPDALRTQGMGQFLGRVMESDSIESLALNGGLMAVMATIQLGTAALVLSQGLAVWLHLGAMVIWVLGILLTSWLSYRYGRTWTETYRNMTNNLVERMVGHRTRLAQESPQRWHTGEDQELGRYQDLSAQYDHNAIVLSAIPASWMIVGLACLIPAILAEPIDITKLAISMGGVMLTYQAFGAIQGGIQSLIQLRLTWGQVQPLFTAASQPGDTGEKSSPTVILAPTTSPQFKSAIPPSENIATAADESTADQKDPQELPSTQIVGLLQENRLGKSPLLVARHLNFRYREYSRMILQDCSLQIFTGDRILLEGSSGGGKSTLAAVLAGLRQVETGALLLHGYDRQSLGAEAWRKRVVIAPQFHENHIFSETFSFNLLMGRNWPPSAQDMDEAAAICNELGLGALLARMPSGWQQMVGENGWQLSHGERSRVFIARALLQNADLIIMDESFGALDPENLYMALECVRRRASTLLVIAHP